MAPSLTAVVTKTLPPHTIGDPWGWSDEVFELTFERIAAALGRVAERLEARGPECSGGP